MMKKVELTNGWDGSTIPGHTKVVDEDMVDECIRDSCAALGWRCSMLWTCTQRDDHVVVDFGSHIHFARVTEEANEQGV